MVTEAIILLIALGLIAWIAYRIGAQDGKKLPPWDDDDDCWGT